MAWSAVVAGSLWAQPSIPPGGNPYWPMANRSAQTVLSQDAVAERKEPAGSAFWLTWALVSPHSDFSKAPGLSDRLDALWSGIAANLRTSPKAPEAGFWSLLPLLESLRGLQSSSRISITHLRDWKSALQSVVDRLLQDYGHPPADKVATADANQYPNSDAQYCAIMIAASEVFGGDKYAASAREFAKGMAGNLVTPLGAWHYYHGSVPVPLYHGFELVFLGRYYQLTHDPVAAAQIRATKDYYPYVFSSPTTVEYSSAAWWKQGWDAMGGAFHAPEFAAWLCGDGRNRWFAAARAKIYQPFYWTVYCAEAWDAGVANRAVPEPPPKKFLVEDRSIDGLRGRNGSFSFVGSRGQSVMSFGGCLIDAFGGYGAYLQVARLGVSVPGEAGKPYYEGIRAAATPAGPVAGSQFLGKDFAVLDARFVPRTQLAPHAPFDDWECHETWFFSPEGVVAIFQVTALRDDPRGEPEGFIRFGPRERPHHLSGDEFMVGPLSGKLLDFDGFEASMGNGAPDQNCREPRIEIRLKLKSRPEHILRGAKWSYAAAFFPEDGTSASAKPRGDNSMDVSIGKRRFRITTGSSGQIGAEML